MDTPTRLHLPLEVLTKIIHSVLITDLDTHTKLARVSKVIHDIATERMYRCLTLRLRNGAHTFTPPKPVPNPTYEMDIPLPPVSSIYDPDAIPYFSPRYFHLIQQLNLPCHQLHDCPYPIIPIDTILHLDVLRIDTNSALQYSCLFRENAEHLYLDFRKQFLRAENCDKWQAWRTCGVIPQCKTRSLILRNLNIFETGAIANNTYSSTRPTDVTLVFTPCDFPETEAHGKHVYLGVLSQTAQRLTIVFRPEHGYDIWTHGEDPLDFGELVDRFSAAIAKVLYDDKMQVTIVNAGSIDIRHADFYDSMQDDGDTDDDDEVVQVSYEQMMKLILSRVQANLEIHWECEQEPEEEPEEESEEEFGVDSEGESRKDFDEIFDVDSDEDSEGDSDEESKVDRKKKAVGKGLGKEKRLAKALSNVRFWTMEEYLATEEGQYAFDEDEIVAL